MGVKVATTCLHWSQPIIHPSPSCSQTLPSAISSPSRRRSGGDGGALVFRCVQKLDRPALFGTPSTKLHRSRSCEIWTKSRGKTIRRSCSASLDPFSDEEFSKKIQELALRFQLSDDEDSDENEERNAMDSESDTVSDSRDNHGANSADSCNNLTENFSKIKFSEKQSEFSASKFDFTALWPETRQEPPDWSAGDEIFPVIIERKANSVDLPLSLRIIKRKLQWQEGFREAGDSAYCSVKKAFSSMVFIIRELHSFTLQMRDFLSHDDLQGILARVQKEMHASFVWLFQQVFSHTPTLMVYVMILLANFTVYSVGNNAVLAASPPPGPYAASATETASAIEIKAHKHQNFDSSAIKTFSVSSSSGKTTSIGGNNGGGKIRPVARGTDGDGTILPDSVSQLPSLGTNGEAEPVSGELSGEEEVTQWSSIVEEASRMQLRDEALNHETMQRFVSPVEAKIEPDDYINYFITELRYQRALLHEPNNPLLLANYAQFLYLVAHDYDRAEEYFKRATEVEPPDAEAYSKYASFLWKAKKDLWAAEETLLEAISADPGNSYHAANYAHFLWNTGGEDTCFPLNPPDTAQDV